MKIDPGSTAIGIVCGAALLAFAVPLGSFVAENVSGLCAATAVSLLSTSAWLAFRTQSSTVRPVGFDLHDPAVPPSEWLASMGAKADDPLASRLVEMGLEAQLKTTGLDDPRVEAFLLCLLSSAPQDLAITTSRSSRSDMLSRLAEAMMDPDLKSGAVRFMEEHGLREDVRLGEIRDTLSERHGTPVTMMLAALEAARSGRALGAPSEFLWLKKVDRRLWYAMSNLGRASFHVEGIAAIAHFREEKVHGRSEVPLIGSAMAALRGECIDRKGSDMEALPAAA
ncbi:secretion/conjugation apparatus DotM-related subunit [Methylobacterium brachiatum]